MDDSYKAAVIQLNSQPDLSSNLTIISQYLAEASKQDVDLVCLPEHTFFLGDFDGRIKQAKEISNKAPLFLKEKANNYSFYIVGATFPVPVEGEKVYNRSVVASPEGKIVSKYDKIHLFDVDLNAEESYRESDFVKGGQAKSVVFKSGKIGNVGLSICYDLRFPELYRAHTDNGAEILTVPSAFTRKTGRAHWEVLLRARAIENTCYILAAAQTGIHGKNRKTYGHSMIINPWGEIIAKANRKPGIITATLDAKKLQKVRASIPCLKHRKL